MYKLDAGSQPECNAHRDHRSVSVRNARQGPANPESSWRIGAPLVGLCTYAPKRSEPLRASYGCAQDSKQGPRGAGQHERMLVMLGLVAIASSPMATRICFMICLLAARIIYPMADQFLCRLSAPAVAGADTRKNCSELARAGTPRQFAAMQHFGRFRS